jgi:hypothetical protein
MGRCGEPDQITLGGAIGVVIGTIFAIVILGELADCGREPPHPAPRDIETAYAAD